MLEIGPVLNGKYKILKEIGQGGMSCVYLALDEEINKQRSVKVIYKDCIQYIDRATKEISEARKYLNHPNLTRIIDVIDNR